MASERTIDGDRCYRALRARDRRFDGLFYVGVATTGIYCRPVCTARLPGRARCTFYRSAAEAERAGFRACFRCRPELAPGCAPLDSVPRLVARASARIGEGFLDDRSIEELAGELGVTSRHLRRAMEAELGVSPIELAEARRLARAKQLLHDTALGTTEIAFASGFRSVRRFHAAFRGRFGDRADGDAIVGSAEGEAAEIVLRLEHRAPYDVEGTLAFLGARAIPGVERVEEGEYARVVRADGAIGVVSVRAEEGAMIARVPIALSRSVPRIAARLRAVLDLDAQPDAVAAVLRRDATLAPLVRRRPGIRVPCTFEAYEGVARAVLGQQVTVRAATTIAGRLARALGAPLPEAEGALTHAFPEARAVAEAGVDAIASLGMPGARARALIAVSRAIADGAIDLTAPGEEVIAALLELPGIGPWTAQYVAMRALRWPDAFPAGDLGIEIALGGIDARAATKRAEAWRPWRAYAVMHLWASLGDAATTKEKRS